MPSRAMRGAYVRVVPESPFFTILLVLFFVSYYTIKMICHFIFYVADQKVSSEFYSKVLDQKPVLDVPGMTEFRLNERSILGLMPSQGIKKLLGNVIQDPQSANGIPRAEIYLRVSNPQAAFKRSLEAGAKLLSPIEKREWGDNAGYLQDPDGHIFAFAISQRL